MSKKIKFGLFAVFCCFFIFNQANAAQALDGIAATVNDAVITQSELNHGMETIKKQLAGNNMAIPPTSVLQKQVLEQLINRKLQMQAAEQAGINITDEEVNKAIDTIAKNNKATTEELYQKVAESGLSKTEYRKEIRNEMTIQQIQQKEVGPKISITPQDVNDYMKSAAWRAFNAKEYHLEDILITLPEAPTPEQLADAKKRATELIAKLKKNPALFRDAAASESGESNAFQGGDLGWRKLPEIPSAFSDPIVRMQVNDIVGPIQTPNGYHILRLAGIRGTNPAANTDDQHKQVQQLIYQRKMEEGLQSWVTRLRSAATINTHL